MSQQDLAETAGVPQSQISKLERGAIDEPALSTIVNIANALGVSADDLTSQSQEALLKKITNKATHVQEANPL